MADATRLGALAAQAFADRSCIDWRALRNRAHRHADRALVSNLQIVAHIRGAPLTSARESAAAPALIRLVTLLAAIATVQTIVGLSIAISASTRADPIDVTAPQMALALAFGLAGGLLAAAARRDRRSLFLLAAFLTAASAFARTAVLDLAWADASPWMRAIDGCATDAFMPACLMLFALDFPRVHRFTRFDVAARRASLVAWLVSGVFFAANLAIDFRLPGSGALSAFYREHPDQMFWRVFTIGLTLPVIAILVRARRAPADERHKVARVAAAIALGSAPFLFAGLVRTFTADVDGSLAAWGLARHQLDTLVMAGLMAIPVLGSCAVLADRPFDLSTLRGAGACIARALRRAERGPLGDSRRDLAGAIERLRLARGIRELEACLAHQLRSGIGASRAHLLLRTDENAWRSTDGQVVDLPGDGAIVAMLDAGAALVDLATAGAVWPLLPVADRRWAEASGVALIAPIGHRDGSVTAIVAMAGRRDGAAFVRADRAFAAALAPVVSALREAAEHPHIGSAAAPTGDGLEAAFECPRCGGVSSTRSLPCTCGAAPALAALPVLVADKFLVGRRLGRGGMGVVYLARDIALDRDVVLKTLPAPGPGRVARLRREARAMAAIRHESLAAIHGLEIWRDTPVLVVEYFPRGTLADRLRAGPLSCAEAARLALDLASALAHMHARGLLHRDIKPANIALTDQGSARLLDFGLAVVTAEDADAGRSANGIADHAAGTPAYAAPETCYGAEAAATGDLWSLSVVTLEALTGANPMRQRPGRAQTAGARWPFEIDMARAAATLAPIAGELIPFFTRALAIDPAARYQSAEEWRDALIAALSSSATSSQEGPG